MRLVTYITSPPSHLTRLLMKTFNDYHYKMRNRILQIVFFGLMVFLGPAQLGVHDKRAQYPGFLANSYYNVYFGYINYHFTNELLEPGFAAESIKTPHFGMRLVFFGY